MFDTLSLSDHEFEQFRRLIYEHTLIVLSETKKQLICTRLSRRLGQLGLQSFGEYLQHLQRNDPDGAELHLMLNAMTTNKTSFFREAHHFSFLRTAVYDPPGKLEVGDRSLRIWSAGCSTGEEAYSIAFTLLDGPQNPAVRDIRILASDINSEVLQKAELGVYPADRLAGITPRVLKRFFVPGKGAWEGYLRVRKQIRDLIAFRRINFRDPQWPIHTCFDCIFFRNVSIYFDKETQEELLCRFAQYLRPGGYLFLGHSESTLNMHLGLVHLGRTTYQKPPSGAASSQPAPDPVYSG